MRVFVGAVGFVATFFATVFATFLATVLATFLATVLATVFVTFFGTFFVTLFAAFFAVIAGSLPFAASYRNSISQRPARFGLRRRWAFHEKNFLEHYDAVMATCALLCGFCACSA